MRPKTRQHRDRVDNGEKKTIVGGKTKMIKRSCEYERPSARVDKRASWRASNRARKRRERQRARERAITGRRASEKTSEGARQRGREGENKMAS